MKKLIPILLLFSCSTFTDQSHIYVASELKPHYIAFLLEAKSRGLDFSHRDIILTFKTIEYCGLTVYNSNTVYIDSTRFCWHTDQREVVFHELGHFFLSRNHDNTVINGKIKSIMIGDGYIINMEKNKDYYYNELFNPKIYFPFSSEENDSLNINSVTQPIYKRRN